MNEIEKQFQMILGEIRKQNWDLPTWAAHESGDWFQTENFCGGFEADESYEGGEFNFSYYDIDGKEWWFTFRLQQVPDLLAGGFKALELTDPETFDENSI